MSHLFQPNPLAFSQQVNRDSGARRWYIRVDGTVYGSFDDNTLWAYVCEGRVTEQSELSLSPTTGFYPAGQRREIAHWFQNQAPVAPPAPEPEYVSLVMAEIRSGHQLQFMQTLQSVGDTQRIGNTVWLVHSTTTLERLSDMLKPMLAPTDRLFMADVTPSDYAAINLGPAVENRVSLMFEEIDTKQQSYL